MDNIKQYEKKNKKSECKTVELSDEEKKKYGIKTESKINMSDIKIDVEFRDLLPPLAKDTYDELEQQIIEQGCLDSLKVWTDPNTNIIYLIDGYNRLDICRKHNITYDVKELQFNSKDEIIHWIIANQLGRRNLSVPERADAVLKAEDIVNRIKQEAKERQGKRNDLTFGSLEPKVETKNTSEKLAELADVSSSTIKRMSVIKNEGTPEQYEKVLKCEQSIKGTYNEIRKNKDIPKIEVESEEIIECAKNKSVKPKTKECLKCVLEKPIDNFYIGHDKCKDCEQEELEKKSNKIDRSYYKDDDELIKDIKSPKNADDYIVIENEIQTIESATYNFISQIDIRFFTVMNVIDKMNNEQIDIAIDMLDDAILKINELKNKFINKKGDK